VVASEERNGSEGMTPVASHRTRDLSREGRSLPSHATGVMVRPNRVLWRDVCLRSRHWARRFTDVKRKTATALVVKFVSFIEVEQ
jgi:hypothetical protein